MPVLCWFSARIHTTTGPHREMANSKQSTLCSLSLFCSSVSSGHRRKVKMYLFLQSAIIRIKCPGNPIRTHRAPTGTTDNNGSPQDDGASSAYISSPAGGGGSQRNYHHQSVSAGTDLGNKMHECRSATFDGSTLKCQLRYY